MGQRWDNFKEEMAWPYVQITNWFAIEDNQEAAYWIAGATAFVALLVYSGLFFGGRAAVNAFNDEVTIAISDQCVNAKGLVAIDAPSTCFAPKPPAPAPRWTPAAETPQKQKAKAPYDPPCVKDKLPGCTDQIYGKRLVEGLVDTVTFKTDDEQMSDDHLQPDSTEVRFAEYDDQEPPSSEKFCGNVLHKFTPGKKIKMVINESKQSDYNGCYVIDVVQLSFGGSPYPKRK